MISTKNNAVTNTKSDSFFNSANQTTFDPSKLYFYTYSNLNNNINCYMPEWKAGSSSYTSCGIVFKPNHTVTFKITGQTNSDGTISEAVSLESGANIGSSSLLYVNGRQDYGGDYPGWYTDGTISTSRTFGCAALFFSSGGPTDQSVVPEGSWQKVGSSGLKVQWSPANMEPTNKSLYAMPSFVTSTYSSYSSRQPNNCTLVGAGPGLGHTTGITSMNISSLRASALVGISGLTANDTALTIGFATSPATGEQISAQGNRICGKFKGARKLHNDTDYKTDLTSATTVVHPQYLGTDSSGYKWFYIHQWCANWPKITKVTGGQDGLIMPTIAIKGECEYTTPAPGGVVTVSEKKCYILSDSDAITKAGETKTVSVKIHHLAFSWAQAKNT